VALQNKSKNVSSAPAISTITSAVFSRTKTWTSTQTTKTRLGLGVLYITVVDAVSQVIQSRSSNALPVRPLTTWSASEQIEAR